MSASSDTRILSALASFSMFRMEGLRTPRSMPDMYVRSSPAISPSASCDSFASVRNCRIRLPNFCCADVLAIWQEWLSVVYRSTDYVSLFSLFSSVYVLVISL